MKIIMITMIVLIIIIMLMILMMMEAEFPCYLIVPGALIDAN